MEIRETIGVVGLGLLGRGIAACLLANGYRVVAWTTGPDTHARASAYIEAAFGELLAHKVIEPEAAVDWRQRYVEADSFSAFSTCTFIIESVIEDFATKQQMFDLIEAAVLPDVPIASNTSALPISLLQASRKHPERFLGMHWAEPAYSTRFLELIRGDRTADAAMQAATLLARRNGKDPAIVQRDVPGFIVNRLGYAMYREAIHLLEAGVADVETIDRSFVNAFGLWANLCGPFRWIDITGGPALYAKAMQGVLPDLANGPELPRVMQEKLEASERGVRDGHGFYSYQPGDEAKWEKLHHAHSWVVWEMQRCSEPAD